MSDYTNRMITTVGALWEHARRLEIAIARAMDDSDEVDGRLLVKPFGYEGLLEAMRGDNADSIYERLTNATPVANTVESEEV